MSHEEYARTGLEIAVIGMAGRFPGAQNIDEFWENLKKGINSITFFTDEELEESGVTPETFNDPNYVKAKGFLEDIEYFDAPFFGYKPREAETADPQVRLLYQCVYHALENAGYDPFRYQGLIGFYAGASHNFPWEILTAFNRRSGPAERFGTLQLTNKDYITTAISYKLNLRGPAITIYTACSTSLVAIHLAFHALLSGECDIALAGGVSVTLPKKSGYLYQPGLIESPQGTCRPFDHKASGIVYGNGVGVVVLKSLAEAIADGDFIHAVLKGSAVNNDGNRKVGFNATSTRGQAEVIRAAYNASQVKPGTIGYIEAHGSGTELGDSIEIEALNLAYNTDKKQYCSMGAVKSNVGHLDAAAGIAGFIKTVLILKHKLIPPIVNFEKPNHKIDFENSPFYINTTLTPWKKYEYPLRAAVNAFGIGGTNAHVILEEAPPPGEQAALYQDKAHDTRTEQLILLSAKTKTALYTAAKNLADYFKKNPDINLTDAAYTLQLGRGAFNQRMMFVCSSLEEAVDILSASSPGRLQTSVLNEDKETARVITHSDKYPLETIGQLWLYGQEIDFQQLYAGKKPSRIPLPVYPFEGSRYWQLVDNFIKEGNAPDEFFKEARKIENISDWYYRPFWKQVELLPSQLEAAKKTGWIVFMEEGDIAARLVEQLENQGHQVICVKTAANFEKSGDTLYFINPLQPDDYKTLFSEIANTNQDTERILYLWTLTGDNPAQSADMFQDPINRSFYCLLWLAQAAGTVRMNRGLQIDVVSDNMQAVFDQDQVQPYKAMLLAPVTVISQEFPQIKCRSIDIMLPKSGTHQGKKGVELLLAELNADSPDNIVAIHSDTRWVKNYEPVKLEESIKEKSPLKKKGTWWIIGGLGRIGMALAKHLASHIQARLVLTGCGEFPGEDQWQEWLDNHDDFDAISRRIQQLKQLQAMGAEIMVGKDDITSKKQMDQVIHRIEKQFGSLNGVVHAAGFLDENTFKIISHINKEDDCLGQFKAKTEGIMVLEKVLQDRELDHCLIISSLSSILGGIGFIAYAAANIFMDAFVQNHNRSQYQKWTTVNLDFMLKESKYAKAMTTEQGAEVLYRLMSWQECTSIAVSTTDMQKRQKTGITVKSKKTGDLQEHPQKNFQDRPNLPTPFVEPQTQMEKKLSCALRDFFSINRVGINDNLFDLGANSMDVVQISEKLTAILEEDIDVAVLFRYPNIFLLAQHLEEKIELTIPGKKQEKKAAELKRSRQSMQQRLQISKKGRKT